MKSNRFNIILKKLSLQSGQEKLHIASQLTQFVNQLRTQGNLYAKKRSVLRSRATA